MELVESKIFLISHRKILLKQFKMVANQSPLDLNRGLLSNSWWLKSTNYVKFTGKRCDVYGEECCRLYNIYNWDKHGFATTSLN